MSRERRSNPIRRLLAFTLIELMVVVSIMVTLIAITLPSFTTMIESSNYTSAINQTTAALGNARAIAMRDNVQTAVAFLFDVRTEQYTLVILHESKFGSSGALSSLPTGPPGHVYALGLRHARNMTPIELPKGTAVFGLSFSHVPDPLIDPNVTIQPAIDDQTWHWYAGEVYLNADDIPENPWIFPRNDPLLFWEDGVAIAAGQALNGPWEELLVNGASNEVVDALRHANSFMVQYNPDGSVVTAFSRGSFSQPANAYIEFPLNPIDLESLDPDPQPYDNPAVFDPELDPATAVILNEFGIPIAINQGERNPEVILRTITQLAIVDLSRLRRGTSVRFPWFLHPSTSLAPWPMEYDHDGRPDSGDEIPFDDEQLDVLVSEVSAWIDQNAEIIGFDRYTGAAIRRVGQ